MYPEKLTVAVAREHPEWLSIENLGCLINELVERDIIEGSAKFYTEIAVEIAREHPEWLTIEGVGVLLCEVCRNVEGMVAESEFYREKSERRAHAVRAQRYRSTLRVGKLFDGFYAEKYDPETGGHLQWLTGPFPRPYICEGILDELASCMVDDEPGAPG